MSVDIWAGVEENQKSEMEYIELTPELKDLAAEAARTMVLPRWLIRAAVPDSEAHRIYNLKVAPIVKTKINADGQAEGVK